jgi:hypothetical protein
VFPKTLDEKYFKISLEKIVTINLFWLRYVHMLKSIIPLKNAAFSVESTLMVERETSETSVLN